MMLRKVTGRYGIPVAFGVVVAIVAIVLVWKNSNEHPESTKTDLPAHSPSSDKSRQAPRAGNPITGIEQLPAVQAVSLFERASKHKSTLYEAINRLYFSHESDDFQSFFEAGRVERRKKELKELLLSLNDPSALAAAMLVVMENGGMTEAIKRLLTEYHSVLRGEERLCGLASAKELIAFLVPYATASENSPDIKAFATSTLVLHTLAINYRRPEDINSSLLRMDSKELTAVGQALVDVMSTEQKTLSQALLSLTGPYLATSKALRDVYATLAAKPPEDIALRRQFLLILSAQKWPVYESQPIFDFMVGSMNPETPAVFSAVTEAFENTPLSRGEDPRSQIYFERLSSAYGYFDSKSVQTGSRDRREDIIRTVLQMDIRGMPALLQDYILKPEVGEQVKLELLQRVASNATSQKDHSYVKTRAELADVMRNLRSAFDNAPALKNAIDRCNEALSQ